MRSILIMITAALAACSSGTEETVMTSIDVDQSDVPALLGDIDRLTGNTLPVDRLLELAISTKMDEEQQDRFTFRFEGSDEDVLIHVWREQVDWLHLYFSSTSKPLIAAIEKAGADYAREGGP